MYNRLLKFALALVVAMFVVSFGGQIEGAVFPVTDRAEILDYEQVGETRTRIWGNVDKVRGCNFVELQWFLGEPGKSVRVDFAFETSSQVRDAGEFGFGPWIVQLTPGQLFDRSFAIVYHDCHPLWLTETRFYP